MKLIVAFGCQSEKSSFSLTGRCSEFQQEATVESPSIWLFLDPWLCNHRVTCSLYLHLSNSCPTCRAYFVKYSWNSVLVCIIVCSLKLFHLLVLLAVKVWLSFQSDFILRSGWNRVFKNEKIKPGCVPVLGNSPLPMPFVLHQAADFSEEILAFVCSPRAGSEQLVYAIITYSTEIFWEPGEIMRFAWKFIISTS